MCHRETSNLFGRMPSYASAVEANEAYIAWMARQGEAQTKQRLLNEAERADRIVKYRFEQFLQPIIPALNAAFKREQFLRAVSVQANQIAQEAAAVERLSSWESSFSRRLAEEEARSSAKCEAIEAAIMKTLERRRTPAAERDEAETPVQVDEILNDLQAHYADDQSGFNEVATLLRQVESFAEVGSKLSELSANTSALQAQMSDLQAQTSQLQERMSRLEVSATRQDRTAAHLPEQMILQTQDGNASSVEVEDVSYNQQDTIPIIFPAAESLLMNSLRAEDGLQGPEQARAMTPDEPARKWSHVSPQSPVTVPLERAVNLSSSNAVVIKPAHENALMYCIQKIHELFSQILHFFCSSIPMVIYQNVSRLQIERQTH